MKKIIVCFMLLGFISKASAEENLSLENLMLLSKMAGVCGVMQQMVNFQNSTKMSGGNEFIERYWTTEFARLGKTQEEFFKECEKSIQIYNESMKHLNMQSKK